MDDRRTTILLVIAAGMGFAAGSLVWGPAAVARGGGSGAERRPAVPIGALAGRAAAETPLAGETGGRGEAWAVSPLRVGGGGGGQRRLLTSGSSARDLWSFGETAGRGSSSGLRSGAVPFAPATSSAPSPAGSPPASIPDVQPDAAPLPWIYLGRFGPRHRPIAVFADRQRRAGVRDVPRGGVLENAFVVDWIGLESGEVGRLGVPDRPSVRLAAGQ